MYQRNSYTKDIEDYGESNIERNLCLIIFKYFMTLSLFYIFVFNIHIYIICNIYNIIYMIYIYICYMIYILYIFFYLFI